MNKNIAISISVLVLVILIGSGFWIVTNKESDDKEILQKEIAVSNDANQNQKEVNTEEVDISNWKTYQDEKYKFEIKYNPDWEIREARRGPAIGGEYLEIVVDKSRSDIGMGINRFKTDNDAKKWIKEEGIGGITKDREFYINDYPAYYMEEDNDKVHLVKNYLIQNNGQLAWFSFQEKYRKFNPDMKKYEETSFSQYLSSFNAMVNSIKFFD